MRKKVYLNLEEAMEEVIFNPLRKAHLNVKDYKIQEMADALISFSPLQEAYVVRDDKTFWEIAEEFAIE